MSLPPLPPPEPLVDLNLGRGILDTVLCGVDSRPEGLEALRQADLLREPEGGILVVTALELASSAEAGWAASTAAAQLEAESQAAIEAARAVVPDATFRIVEGRADQVLLAEAEAADATFIAVGTHEISRPVGIAIGSVATTMLHSAPCSVLVARGRPEGEGTPPRTIVAAVDGSPESALAAAVAFRLRSRFGAEVRLVAARGGKSFDLAAVNAIATGVLVEEGAPVDTLVAGAEGADLLVVGSRGLHGARALGSVSERVAHKAPCSVLVVRRPPS